MVMGLFVLTIVIGMFFIDYRLKEIQKNTKLLVEILEYNSRQNDD